MRTALLLTLLMALPGIAGERAQKPMFKGVELYSWQEDGAWRFCLLPGTNRLKTVAEVRAGGLDLAGLRAELARLAVGEMVSWRELPELPTAMPPAEVVDELRGQAAALDLQLFVPTSR